MTELRKDILVNIHWVKGHSGLQGNEKADYMAKIRGLIEKFQDCFYFSFPILDVATLYYVL